MNTLTVSAPSAGLWANTANLYWTGWSQYAASMHTDVSLRPRFPVFRRGAMGVGAEAPTPVADLGVRVDALTPDSRLVDRAA